MSNQSEWKTFFHETSIEAAISIIRDQSILPSQIGKDRNPLFGPGIYFAMTINGAHNKSNSHGVCLSADVLIHKTKEMDKQDGIKLKNNKKYWEKLRNEGYDSIFGYGMRTGDEVVIFNQEQVKNIKFIKFGTDGQNERPIDDNWNLDTILQTRENKITLFYVTNLQQALTIENSQTIPKEEGQFGNGIYLFNTVEDAINQHPDSNTFITVYADMTNYYKLNPDEKIDSPNVPNETKSFYTEENAIKYFIFTDPSLLSSIHICGDSGIQKDDIGEIFISGIPIDKDFNIIQYEQQLRQLFHDYGILHSSDSIMIKTKSIKEDNLCAFAFVKVENNEQAENAVKNLNFTKINGSPICLFSIDDDIKKIIQTNQGKLFFKNLDPSTNDISQLFSEFSKYGEIVSFDFPSELKCVDGDENNKQYVLKGYGSVQYSDPEVANEVLSQEISFNGKILEIETFYVKASDDKNTFDNCFINNLPTTFKEENLKNLFSKFGTPIRWKLVPNGQSQYGYCQMENHKQAVNAVKGLNGLNTNGFRLKCCRAMSKEERTKEQHKKNKFENIKGREIHVANLDLSVTVQELISIFSSYGQVEFVKIFRDKKNSNLNVGFVCFKTKEEANKCLQTTRSVTIHSNNCGIWMAKLNH